MRWVRLAASTARASLAALLLVWFGLLMLVWRLAPTETSIHQCVYGAQMAVMVTMGYAVYRALVATVSEAEQIAARYFEENEPFQLQ